MKIILEYSDKLIQTVTDKWKQENSKVTDSNAKQLIQRFDQIKNGLSSKLNIVSLPDNLKQGNKYLDITLYSLDDMLKLIKSIPENPEKVKKDAVTNFVEKYQIDKPTAQSYVARFVSKKDDLKFGVKDGIEDRNLSKEDVIKFIPKKLQHNDMFLDPRNWEWEDFEHMLDALFPTQKEVSDEEGENTASTESDKIYDKNGIEVYKGDDVHKCISYNPVVNKKKKYGWCITQPGNTNYDYYRFEERQPTFYFIFDRNKTSEPEHSPFKDVWHAFVLQINSTGGYRITNANNNGDNQAKTWADISKIVPADTWNKIKGLEKLFVPIKLSSTERGRKFASGKNLSVGEFKELSQDEKILYVQGKAQKQQLSNEILEVLTKYKIDLQGRSTTLANVAIDSGQEFPYSILKTNEPLAKRYSIFRFRHTDYGKNPIPLPYVKYLDEEAKAKFLQTFDDNLTFEYIDKYFGENQAKIYVNEQAKTLNYLPDSAIKYISEPKLQNFYKLYNKLFQNWVFSNNTNISDEKLESLKTMPEQIVYPSPLLYDDWKSFNSTERKLFYDIAKRSDANIEKYINASYAVPFFVQKGDIIYALLPESKSMDEWILSDFDGKIISKAKTEDFTLGGQNLFGGYPDYSSSDAKRIYNFSEIKSTKNKLDEIKVANPNLIYNNKEEEQEIDEIRVSTPGLNFNNPSPIEALSKIDSNYFDEGSYLTVFDLGNYYSFIPPFMELVLLIPKEYIALPEYPTDYLDEDELKHTRELINQGKSIYIQPLKQIDEYAYDSVEDESDEVIDRLSYPNDEFAPPTDSRLKTPSKKSFMDDEQISKLAKSVRNRLSEIKVQIPHSDIPQEWKQKIKDEIISYLVDEIKSFNKNTVFDYYLPTDSFRPFILNQMVFSNYELQKDGQDILVSHNNKRLVNEKDIIDYVNGNPKLLNYLISLLTKFYQENVDIDCLMDICLKQTEEEIKKFGIGDDEDDNFSEKDIEWVVSKAIGQDDENRICGSIYSSDVIDDPDFDSFLHTEFNKVDVIDEIKVAEPNADIEVTSDYYANDGLDKGKYQIISMNRSMGYAGMGDTDFYDIILKNMDTNDENSYDLDFILNKGIFASIAPVTDIKILNKEKLKRIAKDDLGKIIDLDEIKIASPSSIGAINKNDSMNMNVSSKSYLVKMDEKNNFTLHKYSKYYGLYPSYNEGSPKFDTILKFLDKKFVQYKVVRNTPGKINIQIPLTSINRIQEIKIEQPGNHKLKVKILPGRNYGPIILNSNPWISSNDQSIGELYLFPDTAMFILDSKNEFGLEDFSKFLLKNGIPNELYNWNNNNSLKIPLKYIEKIENIQESKQIKVYKRF